MNETADDPRRRFLLVASGLLATAVFVVDVLTPHGVEVWVLYLPVILAPVWFNNTRQILWTSAICTVLVVLGSVLFPLGIPPWSDVINRGMGIMAIWLTAIAGITIARHSVQLAAAMEGLRRETAEHDAAKHALARSEQRLRLAVDGARMGTWDMNLRTGSAVWSETQFKMLGYAPAPDGEATVEMWESRIHPDDRASVLKIREQAQHDRTLLPAEYRIVRADNGQIVWLAVYGRFFHDEIGAGVRFIGVSFDISRRKKLEREVLEIAAREQRRIGQELHDSVGQELTGLGLMANALAQRLQDAREQKQIALRLVEGFDRVRQQVRTLSRGLIPVQVEAKGLWAALDDLATTIGEQSGIEVTLDCSEGCDVEDHTRATELFHIAQEAVSNAVRHGYPRHVRMTVCSGADGLRLSIQDDGIGLQRRSAKCPGMGLSIMEYRAEQIGGALQVGPAEGGGTVVTCWLPGEHSNGNGKTDAGRRTHDRHREDSHRG